MATSVSVNVLHRGWDCLLLLLVVFGIYMGGVDKLSYITLFRENRQFMLRVLTLDADIASWPT